MSASQLNRELALLLGWKGITVSKDCRCASGLEGFEPCERLVFRNVPDFCGDWNALMPLALAQELQIENAQGRVTIRSFNGWDYGTLECTEKTRDETARKALVLALINKLGGGENV